MVPLLYLSTEADRPFVGVGIGATEVFPSITGGHAQRHNVLIITTTDDPFATRMPWSVVAAPLIFNVVLVLTRALSLEANGTFTRIRHGAGETLAAIARFDLDRDNVLVVPRA